jgi:hypothetical protein
VTTLSAPTYTVTITGVASGPLSHSATVTLIVIP